MQNIIQLLPDVIANQIAAGEVVQRPSSVVKELLENAIDAGGTEINVLIKDAGKALIQVCDNGSGMSAHDARMSFSRHATSKIRVQEDIFNIRTLGFRGEALAAISAVSQVKLRTRMHSEELGIEVEVEGGKMIKQEACVCHPGSCFQVSNLFYNTPARRNFLKSNPVETRHILTEFIRVAIPNPHIAFSFTHNETEVYDLPPASLSDRVASLLGEELSGKMIEVNESTGYVRISGVVGDPSIFRQKKGDQFFFVNGRFIKNGLLHHALATVYEDFIPKDTHPFYCIFLELDPSHIDINIHPTKTEIKFDDERTIYELLKSVAKGGLGDALNVPQFDFGSNTLAKTIYDSQPANAQTIENYQQKQLENLSPTRNHWDPLYQNNYSDQLHQPNNSTDHSPPVPPLFSQKNRQETDSPELLVQFQQNYIITQYQNKLYIIDQHLAHQRILFERFFQTRKNGAIPSQQLLFPQTLELNQSDYHLIKEVERTITHMGFEVKDFGPDTLIVYGTPSEIPTSRIRDIFEQILAEVKESGTTHLQTRITEAIAKAISMKSAVTSGQKLSIIEMDRIVKELFQCEIPSFAPNGTPTFKVIPTVELEDYFK